MSIAGAQQLCDLSLVDVVAETIGAEQQTVSDLRANSSNLWRETVHAIKRPENNGALRMSSGPGAR